jgi:hypothetical protein
MAPQTVPCNANFSATASAIDVLTRTVETGTNDTARREFQRIVDGAHVRVTTVWGRAAGIGKLDRKTFFKLSRKNGISL